MANNKLAQQQIEAIERLKRLSGNFTAPLTAQDRLRFAIERRETVYEKYRHLKLVTIPEDYPVPVKGKLALRERGDKDPAPLVSVLCDMSSAFGRNNARTIKRELIREEDSFDHVALNVQEWRDLINREAEHIKDLPIPFYHEALQNFTVRMEDGSIIPFRRSNLSRIEYNGYDIIPMVDALMNTEHNRTTLFGLGLINVEEDIYMAAIYWFGNVDKQYHANVVNALDGYFYAQWAFHACPERIIEVSPGDPNPFEEGEEEEAPKSRKRVESTRPHRATIGRKIYVRDPLSLKKSGTREIERHCRCWYVHGFMRTYHKTGKQVWVHGYFKGPDRDNPAARSHVKDYVMS